MNDTVCCRYINLLRQHVELDPSCARVHLFDTFYYASRIGGQELGWIKQHNRWGARFPNRELDSLEYICLPVNPGASHWTVGVINVVKNTLTYIDGYRNPPPAFFYEKVRAWWKCIRTQAQTDLDPNRLLRCFHHSRTTDGGPIQSDAHNCGVLMLRVMLGVVLRTSLTINPRQLDRHRLLMAQELLSNRLLLGRQLDDLHHKDNLVLDNQRRKV